MPSDYRAIRSDNERRYGTDIGRIGPMLLADRYDDRTHFIYELLQNAEDALTRRVGWAGSRSVTFRLTEDALRVSHFGRPFDEQDVRGICGIAESTKSELTAIGRFGIGFKSVYAFTDRPEVHSGEEHFAIESFVWPVAVPPVEHERDQTLILLPFRAGEAEAHGDVAGGLRRLGPTSLLFLRQIEEVRWEAGDRGAGLYLRQSSAIDGNVRRVSVLGQEQEEPEIEENWLVFSKPIESEAGDRTDRVEIAFSLVRDKETDRERVLRVERSPLVAFFPTVVETHLGFLVQGPYRTTPSRDNVPRGDVWNRSLMEATAALLADALRWLRDGGLLDTAAIRCLPLDRMKFGLDGMFSPLFHATRRSLESEPLLPRFDAGHAPASAARLARTKELRELFAPAQLGSLFRERRELFWLSGEITQDRAQDVRQYLTQELRVPEVTPESVIPRLEKSFLEEQPDAWVVSLYEFLNGQPALKPRLSHLPLVRLEDGSHVSPRMGGQPQAFLPGGAKTDFPTVRRSVCASAEARDFLQSLGLTEPDPVDDVVRHLLPRYGSTGADPDEDSYGDDLRRILTAFATDSTVRREKLIAALRQTEFVMAVDAGDGTGWVAKPGDAYLATERLKELFAGVTGVLLVDDSYASLRGEQIRDLLEACGAPRHLQPVSIPSPLDQQQLRELRRTAGCESMSSSEPVADTALRGLADLLKLLPTLDGPQRVRKAGLLWEALSDVEDRRGTGIFSGTYRWTYYHARSTRFDAAFVRLLNESQWVPDADGELQRPEFVPFESLGWKSDPFLQSKIRFKPPIIEALAREAGIEPGVLDLLKRYGVTSEAELRKRLGLSDEPTPRDGSNDTHGGAALPAGPASAPLAHPAPFAGSAVPAGGSPAGGSPAGGSPAGGSPAGGSPAGGDGSHVGGGTSSTTVSDSASNPGSHPFVSYVAADPGEEDRDPDGLDHAARMALEARAIDRILSREPRWQRTAAYNPGFDLYQADEHGEIVRWCEVKAMTGGLNDRPVGMSRTQFSWAKDRGDSYWLYIVEGAGGGSARVVRIQDPAGKARTFTFDRGWLSVAESDGP